MFSMTRKSHQNSKRPKNCEENLLCAANHLLPIAASLVADKIAPKKAVIARRTVSFNWQQLFEFTLLTQKMTSQTDSV
jgi:hypothetical protein